MSLSLQRFTILTLILAGLFNGCGATYGTPPPIDRLDHLQIGATTHDEVRAVMGEPQGDGAMLLFPSLGTLDAWFYEYMEIGAFSEPDVTILLIFVDREHYSGHLWFSQFPVNTPVDGVRR